MLTSVVATAVSEVTLLVLYGTGALGAGVAAVVANLAGTVPSYPMSRYWIWPEADRHRAGRQVVLYFAVSLVSLAVSSSVTGLAGTYAPGGRATHLLVVAVAYIGTYGLLWLGKFALYQLVLFRPPAEAAESAESPDAAESAGTVEAAATPTGVDHTSKGEPGQGAGEPGRPPSWRDPGVSPKVPPGRPRSRAAPWGPAP